METSQQFCSNETATEGPKLRSADPLLCHGSSLPDSPPPGTVNNVVVRRGGGETPLEAWSSNLAAVLWIKRSGHKSRPGHCVVFFKRQKSYSHSVFLHPSTLRKNCWTVFVDGSINLIFCCSHWSVCLESGIIEKEWSYLPDLENIWGITQSIEKGGRISFFCQNTTCNWIWHNDWQGTASTDNHFYRR